MATESSVMAVVRASRPSFRNAHDKIAFAVHSAFLAAGYALTATGQTALSDPPPAGEEEVGIEGWNEFEDSYGFVYTKKEKGVKKSVLVKCLAIGDILAIDALDLGQDQKEPFNLQIKVTEYLSDDSTGNYGDLYKNFQGLVDSVNSSVLAKLDPLPKASSSSAADRFVRYSGVPDFDVFGGDHNLVDMVAQSATELSPISGQPTSTARRSRTRNFSVEEDKMLISAWLNINMSAMHDKEQGHKQFWARILEFYNKYKNFESDRTQNSLMHRWSNIQLATNKFCSCYAQIEARHQSDINEYDKIHNAKELYKTLHHSTGFPFEHCWNELRYQPKWMECTQKKKCNTRINVTSPAKSSPSTPKMMSLGDGASAIGIERPPNRKTAKEHLKRKGKGRVDEEGNVRIYELFKGMKEQNALYTEKKIEMLEKTYKQDRERVEVEKARLEHEQEKFRVEHEKFQRAEDERIMMIDVVTLPPAQAMYYRRRQKEILARGM